MSWQLPIGALVTEHGVRFRVWAADVKSVEVVLVNEHGDITASHPLSHDDMGYYVGLVEGIGDGTRYYYRLDGDKLRPDPASRYQPESVHGPSQIVDPRNFKWHNSANWQGLPLEQIVVYEVHIGTATPAGTFDSFIEKLDYIKQLGVTAIEIMPVADFPGDRNWGYDGVDLFAPARAYGGGEGLRRLIDAAHGRGLAVIQDVVYNHFGPDGNYLRDYSRDYFTDAIKTPWGDALNFASEEVREFFVANALYWVHEYQIDGFRLDATHAIIDPSPTHILAEIANRVRNSLPAGRHCLFFAEDERNDVRLLQPAGEGGYGLDGVWADDFHHEIRSSVAGDNEGYYRDFTGKAEDIAETLAKGWFYTGQLSDFSGEERGTDASQFDPAHFVYCIQNHDQIGNRALGDRLNEDIGQDAYRAASALLLLSPYTPLLFQGQEWAASTPFQFFTDHNSELGKLITEGRRAEFKHFSDFSGAVVPDPQAVSTFENSKLKWDEIDQDDHARTLKMYRDLLAMRHVEHGLQDRQRAAFQAAKIDEDAIAMRYQASEQTATLVLINLRGSLNIELDRQDITRAPDGKEWRLIFSSDDPKYTGQPQAESELDGQTVRASTPVALVLRT